MSENQPEANDQELEQVSGGGLYQAKQDAIRTSQECLASQEQLRLQSAFCKSNQPIDTAIAMMKSLAETERSVISRI